MARRPPSRSAVDFSLPPPPTWLVRVLGALLAIWVGEMVLTNFIMGDPSRLYRVLAWIPALNETLLYQPLTRFLIRGRDLFGVLIDLMILYFFLPWIVDRFTRRDLWTAAAAVVIGCLAAGLLWLGLSTFAAAMGLPAAGGWMLQPALGWHPFVLAMVVLFALAIPDATINLFFVLPMKARWILWLTIGFAALGFIANPGLPSFERFGAIGAAVAWFHFVGPGATRRRFRKVGKKIEQELKFKVYDGGRSGRGGSKQGRQRRDDDTWH